MCTKVALHHVNQDCAVLDWENVCHSFVISSSGSSLTITVSRLAIGAGIQIISFGILLCRVGATVPGCKGVHSLMPDLGCVVDNDRLVRICPGFHQRYD